MRDKMKKIVVLSVQHTGTFFASATLAAAYPNSHLRIGSLYEKHNNLGHTRYVQSGPIELSDFVNPSDIVNETFFDQAVTSVCVPSDLADKDIVIGHEHYHKADSWLLKALKNAPAGTPIVTPLRDPILSLHSKIWREIEQHNNAAGLKEKARLNRLNKWIKLYYDIFSIPEGHIFKLPIDAEHSKTQAGRIKLIEDMYGYCNLPFNESAALAAKNWKPANSTHRLIENSDKTPKPRWEAFKARYYNGDVEHTKKIMGLEFERLNQEDDLKKLMEKAGYRNVLWW
jgi:hypothetical protein